ncbi:hypothetical protein [Nocardia lijiangensis]|uniref:hypothetical protein n=1 Tax=Nocardia lijiangensis TaxID=299618 RepID=UPI0012DD5383|nr:hypothetical protein [Nocardia lijiangensis]
MTTLRTNRILVETLSVDAQETLESLTTAAAPALVMAVEFTKEWIGKAAPNISDTDEPAALIARLMHSLVLTPDAPPHLTTEDELHAFATRWICPLILTG